MRRKENISRSPTIRLIKFEICFHQSSYTRGSRWIKEDYPAFHGCVCLHMKFLFCNQFYGWEIYDGLIAHVFSVLLLNSDGMRQAELHLSDNICFQVRPAYLLRGWMYWVISYPSNMASSCRFMCIYTIQEMRFQPGLTVFRSLLHCTNIQPWQITDQKLLTVDQR